MYYQNIPILSFSELKPQENDAVPQFAKVNFTATIIVTHLHNAPVDHHEWLPVSCQMTNQGNSTRKVKKKLLLLVQVNIWVAQFKNKSLLPVLSENNLEGTSAERQNKTN